MLRLMQSIALILLLGMSVGARAESEYEGAEILSVWQRARQIQLDYIDQVKKQLEADPENLSLQVKLGRACYWLALGREVAALVEAEKIFEQVLARDPSNAVALAHNGSLLGLKIGFKQVPVTQLADIARQASLEMDRAVTLAPDSIEIRLLRGYSNYYAPSVIGRDQLAV